MFPRVLVVQMDYHKTLPTPKVTSQDWYYSRKLRTHLLGVYVANEDCLHCYFYWGKKPQKKEKDRKTERKKERKKEKNRRAE